MQNDPAHRYDENIGQRREQIRLGIDYSPEPASVQEDITHGLNIVEDDFWPHVTLGLARENIEASAISGLQLPVVSCPAPSVDAQQEVSPAEFTTLIRKDLPTS
ncbi:hypothetical protein C5F59_000120 [Streptomyces sp. QL37]|uniref:hypothetical protein n=1 Tax=Streptomyces sp. QL37 TaxID=2093747 RepID=UPI0011B0BD8A|nr:hypothetical protein [Streptomyces sp. QL37]